MSPWKAQAKASVPLADYFRIWRSPVGDSIWWNLLRLFCPDHFDPTAWQAGWNSWWQSQNYRLSLDRVWHVRLPLITPDDYYFSPDTSSPTDQYLIRPSDPPTVNWTLWSPNGQLDPLIPQRAIGRQLNMICSHSSHLSKSGLHMFFIPSYQTLTDNSWFLTYGKNCLFPINSIKSHMFTKSAIFDQS